MALFQRDGKKGERFVVIFDIGSGSIGGALVGIDGKNPPEIVFTTRRDIPFQEKLNFQRFLDSMLKTLEEIVILMEKAGGGMRVDQVSCVLSLPWYASQTRLIKYSQETAFTVTEKELESLIQKEVALFRDSKLFTHLTDGDIPPEVMELKNIQIKLNGYEIRHPYGKKASELEIAVYISMIPTSIRAAIGDLVNKLGRLSSVRFSSFSFAAFDAIRGIFPGESSFLFMDISGEVTDISLIKDNVLLESISFPAGKNMLIRALVREMKTTPALAIAELELYSGHTSTPEHGKLVEKALGETTRKWQVSFDDALLRFGKEFPIPRTIFYTADDNITEWFGRAIEETSSMRFSQEDGAFSVRSLGNTFLNKFVRILEPDFQDPFLAIEAIFVNKLSSLA